MVNPKKSLIYKSLYPLNSLYRKLGFLLILLSFIPLTLELIGIGMIAPIIIILFDENIGHIPILSNVIYFLKDYFNLEIITVGVSLLVFVFLVKALFLTLYALVFNAYLHKVFTSLSLKLFNSYLSRPYIYFSNQNSSFIIKNIISEVGTYVSTIAGFMRLINDLLMMIGIIILLLLYEPKISLAVIFLFGTIGTMYFVMTKKIIKEWGNIRNKSIKYVIQFVQQGLSAIKEVKLYARETVFLELFNFYNTRMDWSKRKRLIVQQVPVIYLELIGVFIFAIIVFYLVGQNREPENVISVLGILGFSLIRILPVINRLISNFQSIIFATAPINNLYDEFLNFKETNIQNIKDFVNFNKNIKLVNSDSNQWFKKEITISNLSFNYPGKDKVLDNVSLKIEKGKYIGIIGKSGSGKSTFVDLLMGLLDSNKGDIKLDGKNIYEDIKMYRSLFGYVPQDVFLIDDSIKKNITFGIIDSLVDDNRLKETIKTCQLENLIDRLQGGVNFIVGENGSKLSGGEKQRIGIARALYHNPDILILDEATSSLDQQTENDILSSIKKIKLKKTVIFISHKKTSLSDCEIIYKVEDRKLNITTKNL